MIVFVVEFKKCRPSIYSRILLKYLLNKFFKKDLQIFEDNGKPYILDNLHFSISHSKNILVVAFDEYPIGIDIEYSLKERSYNDILNQIGYETIKDITQEEFYKIWTIYEADFKSGIHQENICFYYKDYICSLSSYFKCIPKIYEVKIPQDKIVTNEFINLNLVKDISQNKNSVVLKKFKIGPSELLSLPILQLKKN